MYNLKDLARINQEIGESGELREKSNIEFALDIVKRKKSWLYELAYLLRSLIVDHPFIDGNKRTAYMLCILYFEDNKQSYDDEKLVKIVYQIAKKSTTDINKIIRMILKCLSKKD